MIVAPDDRPDVIAIVPTLGGNDDRLSRCLQSLVGQRTQLRLSIVCVVNGGDPSAVLPPLTAVLRPGLNLGWGGALSFARSLVDADFLWLVQDDMTVSTDCLSVLWDALAADSRLGSVSPVTVDDEGNVPASSVGGVLAREPDIRLIEWLPPASVPPDQIAGLDRLDYVASRGTLVRTAAWDSVGGLDPQFYPVTWSDVDFCTALRAAGWRFGLVTGAVARHEHRGSTPSAYGQFLFGRNNDRFAKKWGAELGAAAPRAPLDPAIPRPLLEDVARAAAGALSDLSVAYGEAIAEADELRARLGRATRETDELRHSHSWRITAPLRAVAGRLLRGLSRG